MREQTIGQVARQAGVAIETIRFYERRGLIEPSRRSEGNFRLYDLEAVRRLLFIRQAKEIGFSLNEIGELLTIRQGAAADCADVRGRALRKIEEVDRKINSLRKIRNTLSRLSESCPGNGPIKDCPILDSLQSAKLSV